MKTLVILVSAACLAAASATAACAQDAIAPAGPAPAAWGQRSGPVLGLQLVFDGIGSGNATDASQPHIDDMGSGLVLVGGWTFAPHFHARVTLGSAKHGNSVPGLDVLRSVGTLEAHYRFLPERPVCPYVFGALGGTDVRLHQGANHATVSGGSAGIGAGVLAGFTPRVALDVSLRYEAVNWRTVDLSQDQPGGGSLGYHAAVEESGDLLRLQVGTIVQF